MKRMYIIVLLFIIGMQGFSQEPGNITDEELTAIQKDIEYKALMLQQELESDDGLSEFGNQISVEFTVDTFRINQIMQRKFEIDYSTYGMTQTMYDGEKEYDKLLNKYYQMVLKKLNDTDKEVLKQSQRNWIRFRDSERELNGVLVQDEYSGGGTVQMLVESRWYLNNTQKRVYELVEYLLRIIN